MADLTVHLSVRIKVGNLAEMLDYRMADLTVHLSAYLMVEDSDNQ
jgi:hypothetical protein